ncbi:Pectinesterase inhibitor domain [Macleaya cordata]|uniref:Pectinesterase inhibitor domain n=1 Tax=Macleaya cordata TaxID=56857 RepID=A0A200PR75_MACCD|nr:Pectinesterase inhibitor domain [Macleaya cordata]
MASNFQQKLLLVLLAVVVLISFFHYDQSYAAAAALVVPESGNFLEETCRHTHFYDLCVSSLQSDSRSSSNTSDLKGLLRISLDLATTNASHILSYIDNLLDNYNTSSNLNLTSLEFCEEDYGGYIATDLEWAIDAIYNNNNNNDGEDYELANSCIDEAITSTDFCKRGIDFDHDVVVVQLEAAEPIIPEPLANMNDIMSKLLHISQDILCYLSPDSCRQ